MTGSQGEGRRTARRDDRAGAVAQVCVPRRRCLGRGGQCCPWGPRHERGESQLCPPSAENSAPWAQRWEALENSSWRESPDSYRQHWPLWPGPLSDGKVKGQRGREWQKRKDEQTGVAGECSGFREHLGLRRYTEPQTRQGKPSQGPDVQRSSWQPAPLKFGGCY